MIYSESKKFLFCHVPKTGGTSITSLFSDYTSPFQQSNFSKICRRIPFAEKTYKFYDFLNRPHTTCYKAKTLFGKKFYSLFCFAIVREPVEWLYSCFRHYKRHCYIIKGLKNIYKPTTFDEFLEIIICLEPQLRPRQSLMLVDSNGKLLADSVGIFSELDQYYSYIRDYLNLSSNSLPHQNKNNILHDNNLPFESCSYKDFVMKHWSSDYSLYELAQTTRFSSGLKNMRIYPTALSINLNKYDPWSLFAKPKIN